MKLNLGCGPDIRDGYINVDGNYAWFNKTIPSNCVAHDLNVVPWPFADESADEILMWHVLEHLPDTFKVMSEVHRILKKGGRFVGQVPYGPSHDGRSHWQHCRFFVAKTFPCLAVEMGFNCIKSKNGTHSLTWRHKLRNAVPFRETLALAGWSEAFDIVDFELEKK